MLTLFVIALLMLQFLINHHHLIPKRFFLHTRKIPPQLPRLTVVDHYHLSMSTPRTQFRKRSTLCINSMDILTIIAAIN